MQHDGAALSLLTVKVLPSETESATSYFCIFQHVSVSASTQTLMLKRYSGTSPSRCLWLRVFIPLPSSQTGGLTISGSLISLSCAANCSETCCSVKAITHSASVLHIEKMVFRTALEKTHLAPAFSSVVVQREEMHPKSLLFEWVLTQRRLCGLFHIAKTPV